MHIYIQNNIQADFPILVGVCEGKILGDSSHFSDLKVLNTVLSTLTIEKGKSVDVRIANREHLIFWDVDIPQSVYDTRCQGGKLWTLLQSLPYKVIQILPWSSHPEELLYGIKLRNWRFDTYRTAARPMPVLSCQHLHVLDTGTDIEKALQQRASRIESIHWTRQRCNEPANILTPQVFADHLREFTKLGIKVDIIEQAELEAKGFGALLGVGQGSIHPPCLAVLEWNGAGAQDPRTTLVGKGVTFDTGGISIKPSGGMEEMKMDMSGAAVVTGVIRAVAMDKLPVNLSVLVPLVENAVSGTAQRPGDIVYSLSGQTIEVLNTDAEGRLILADALWYAQERFSSEVIIDVATLTGAARVALGPEYAPIFGTCDDLVKTITFYGKEEGEKFWQLPLDPAFDRALDSDCADIKNITGSGYGAGSATAAQFLKRFIKPGQKWAHLDIANVDHLTSEHPLCPKGGCGFGFQTLYAYVSRQVKV